MVRLRNLGRQEDAGQLEHRLVFAALFFKAVEISASNRDRENSNWCGRHNIFVDPNVDLLP